MAGTGKEIGIHAHNNMQLAFANTIEAIILGANRMDATMGGLGPRRRQLSYGIAARIFAEPEISTAAGHSLLQDHIEPLKSTVEWGPVCALQHYGANEPSPPGGDSVPRDERERRLREVLRRDRRGRVNKHFCSDDPTRIRPTRVSIRVAGQPAALDCGVSSRAGRGGLQRPRIDRSRPPAAGGCRRWRTFDRGLDRESCASTTCILLLMYVDDLRLRTLSSNRTSIKLASEMKPMTSPLVVTTGAPLR